MTKNRRKFTAEQKAEIVRRHLKDRTPISSLAEELAIQPTQIYQWVALALEQLDKLFARSEPGKAPKAAQKMADLRGETGTGRVMLAINARDGAVIFARSQIRAELKN